MDPRLNLICGEGRPPAGGGTFELEPTSTGGRWPRSGASDARAACDGLREGHRDWLEVPETDRLRILTRALEELRQAPDPEGMIGAPLGLDPGACRALLERDLAAPDLPAPTPRESPGIALVRPHWSQLLGRGLRLVAAELLAGSPVLLLSDGHCPGLAERLAHALLSAGLPGGALALLHDDGDSALRAALGAGAIRRLVSAGCESRARELERVSEGVSEWSGFGAGLRKPTACELHFELLRPGRARVELEEDPGRAARRICRAAFGLQETLCGQLPGSVGEVAVHARIFSAFTGALLEALESEPLPTRLVEPELGAYLDGVHRLGLDEGATLIHEARAENSHPGGTGAKMLRLVFTNVEPGMRLVDLCRPAPLLILRRSGKAPNGGADGAAPSDPWHARSNG